MKKFRLVITAILSLFLVLTNSFTVQAQTAIDSSAILAEISAIRARAWDSAYPFVDNRGTGQGTTVPEVMTSLGYTRETYINAIGWDSQAEKAATIRAEELLTTGMDHNRPDGGESIIEGLDVLASGYTDVMSAVYAWSDGNGSNGGELPALIALNGNWDVSNGHLYTFLDGNLTSFGLAVNGGYTVGYFGYNAADGQRYVVEPVVTEPTTETTISETEAPTTEEPTTVSETQAPTTSETTVASESQQANNGAIPSVSVTELPSSTEAPATTAGNGPVAPTSTQSPTSSLETTTAASTTASTTQTVNVVTQTSVAPVTTAAPAKETLPKTGEASTLWVMIAAVLAIVAGAFLILTKNKRK